MTSHTVGSRDEWRAARLALLDAEKELTRRSDALAAQRQQLPWVRIDKDYRFDSASGEVGLVDLFGGRSQLIVQHFMYPPSWDAGCPSCSAMADGWSGSRAHLEHHDVAMVAVSRAPLEQILAYERRMGWTFPWVSSFRNDFNFDFGVSFTEAQLAAHAEYNFRPTAIDVSNQPENGSATDAVDDGESPGVSTFAREGDVVYHCYSAYSRGLDALWGMYAWLDRAPLGRNESGMWWKRHDEYSEPT